MRNLLGKRSQGEWYHVEQCYGEQYPCYTKLELAIIYVLKENEEGAGGEESSCEGKYMCNQYTTRLLLYIKYESVTLSL